MILPPSFDELKSRLVGRGTENSEKIANRMSRIDYELSLRDKYDYIVVNDDLDRAVGEIEEIIKNS